MSSPDNTRRHWHGDPGARHEHLNVWTHGGAKGPAVRAPWALTPEMMATGTRRDSNTSTTSANGDGANANTNANANSSSPPTVSERRRSSSTSSGLFANLQTLKRESTDPSMVGRRASWNEQREQRGWFAKFWDGYTRGK